MNRNDLIDRINYCRRELDVLQAMKTDCTTCDIFRSTTSTCGRFGEVPADFIEQGCDGWIYNEPPF